MKINHLLGALFCLPFLLHWGCTDSRPGMAIPETEVTIHASQDEFVLPDPTRSVIGGIGTDGALVMNWGVGDEMGVFSSSDRNVKFVSTNTAPAASADFKPETATGIQGEPTMGYYPYAAGNTDAAAIAVTIPATQEYSDANSIARYDYKAAKITMGKGGKYLMKMKQIVTLLRFQINLKDVRAVIGSGFDTAERLEKVVLGSKTPMAGTWKYNLNDIRQEQVRLVSVKPSSSLTLNFTGKPYLTASADKDGNMTAYAIVVPGSQKGQTLSCDLYTDRHIIKLTADIICDFNAGTFYTIPLNASIYDKARKEGRLSVEANGTTPPGLPHPAENEETANCYMINTTGAHEFWGTQIGNGAKGIIKGAGFHTEDPFISPKSAGLLWQDVKNFISDISFNPADGKVHYKANSTSGNAVIAVYDGENGTGNILWSWHIWGTGGEPVQSEEYTNLAGAKFQVMDRMLGAHSLTSSNITFYQWGRKDPYPSATTYYPGTGEAVDISKSFPYTRMENPTLAYSIGHPEQMMDSKSTDYGNTTWVHPENNLLWGDNNLDDCYTIEGKYNNPAKAGSGWTHKKTIYDPSPAGYRVANKFTFTGFLPKVNDGGYKQGSGTPDVNNVNGTPQNNGWYFKRDTTDKTGAFYPMSGQRYPWAGELSEYGKIVFVWSSAPQKNTWSSQHLQFSYLPGQYNSMKWEMNATAFSYRSRAMGVRCVKE